MNGMASSHTTSLSIRSLSSSSLGEGSNLMYKATFTNVQTLMLWEIRNGEGAPMLNGLSRLWNPSNF